MKKLIPILLICLALCSCTIIHEDTAAGIYAPEIDPEPAEGVIEKVSLLLYFPMANEPYMCSQTREVEVSANTSIETVLLNQLLKEGPKTDGQKSSGDLTAVLDTNVDFTAVRKGSVIEVTLSKEFLGTSIVVDIANERQRRKLSIYCIVNTLTQEDSSLSVQILIDDDGDVRKPRYEEVGITKPLNSSDTLEPLTFSADSILTLRKAAENILNAASTRDAETLYKYLLSESRPTQDELQETLYNVYGLVEEYTINSESESADKNSATVNVYIALRTKDTGGTLVKRPGNTLPLVKEGDIWKVDYKSLENIIFIKNEPPAPTATGDLPAA